MIKNLWEQFWLAFERWGVNILSWLENIVLNVLKKFVVNAINIVLVVVDMMLIFELWVFDLIFFLVDLLEFFM